MVISFLFLFCLSWISGLFTFSLEKSETNMFHYISIYFCTSVAVDKHNIITLYKHLFVPITNIFCVDFQAEQSLCIEDTIFWRLEISASKFHNEHASTLQILLAWYRCSNIYYTKKFVASVDFLVSTPLFYCSLSLLTTRTRSLLLIGISGPKKCYIPLRLLR